MRRMQVIRTRVVEELSKLQACALDNDDDFRRVAESMVRVVCELLDSPPTNMIKGDHHGKDH